MTRRATLRSFACTAAFAALLALAPSRAEADTDPAAFWGATIGVGVPMLAIDAILVGEAIDKGQDGHGLYATGATLEIVWGAVHVVGAGAAVGLSLLAYDPAPLALTFALPLTAIGAYFIGHGIWSLTEGSPSPLNFLFVSIAPTPGGVHAIAQGTF